MKARQAMLLAAIIVAIDMAIADSLPKDLSIEATLPANISLENASYAYYDRLFRITNLGHVSGTTDSIGAFVEYNISSANFTFFSNFTLLGINSFKATGTGSFNFTADGIYAVCGRIANASFPDNNTENNAACMDVLVFSNASFSANTANGTNTTNATEIMPANNATNETSCNVSISIRTEKDIFEDEAIVFYNEISPKTGIGNFSIEYWAEDLFGNVVKARLATTNLNSKQFTPKMTERDRVFVIKNRLYAACLKESLSSEKIVIYKNAFYQEQQCPAAKAEEKKCKTDVIYIQNNSK